MSETNDKFVTFQSFLSSDNRTSEFERNYRARSLVMVRNRCWIPRNGVNKLFEEFYSLLEVVVYDIERHRMFNAVEYDVK